MSTHVVPVAGSIAPVSRKPAAKALKVAPAAQRAAPADRQQAVRQVVQQMLANAGVTLTELARRAGISSSTLTRFMNKDVKHTLSTTTLDKLAAVTGVRFEPLAQVAPSPAPATPAPASPAASDNTAEIEDMRRNAAAVTGLGPVCDALDALYAFYERPGVSDDEMDQSADIEPVLRAKLREAPVHDWHPQITMGNVVRKLSAIARYVEPTGFARKAALDPNADEEVNAYGALLNLLAELRAASASDAAWSAYSKVDPAGLVAEARRQYPNGLPMRPIPAAKPSKRLLALMDKFGMLPDIPSLISGIRQIHALDKADPDKSDARGKAYYEAADNLTDKLVAAEPRTLEEAALKLEFLLDDQGDGLTDANEEGLRSIVASLRSGFLQPAPVPTAAVEPAPSPDAHLSKLADQHIANKRAYNSSPGDVDTDHPLWAAYERTRDALHAAVPQTVVGMLAIARAAKDEAWDSVRGKEDPEGTPAARWSWNLVNDLLRLNPPMNPAQPSQNDLSLECLGHDALDSSRKEEEARRRGGKYERSDAPEEQALYDAAQAEAAQHEDRWLMALREMAAIPADGPIGYSAKMVHVLRNMQAGMVDEEIALARSLYEDLRRQHPDMPPIPPGGGGEPTADAAPLVVRVPGGTFFHEPASPGAQPAPRSCEALARKLAEINHEILQADREGTSANSAGQDKVAAHWQSRQTSLTISREKTEDRVLDTPPASIGDALAVLIVGAGRINDLSSNEYSPEEIGVLGETVWKALSNAFYVLAQALQVGADLSAITPVDCGEMGPENYLQVVR